MRVEYDENSILITIDGITSDRKQIDKAYLEKFQDCETKLMEDSFGNIYGLKILQKRKV